jgi:two-component system OmpR family sensor kinase
VRWANRWQRVSLFGRTLLLLLVAFLTSSALGLAIFWDQLPKTRSVSLNDVARELRIPEDGFSRGPGPPGGPRAGSGNDFGGPPGPPPGEGFDGSTSSGPRGSRVASDLFVSTSPRQPTLPTDSSLVAADDLRMQLAQLLGVKLARVLVYIEGSAQRGKIRGSDLETSLSRRFVAARQLPDERWRIVESQTKPMLNDVERRGIVYITLCTLVLLPFSWAFARAVTSPLRRFAEAAKRLGQDANAPLLPREGSAEMRAAVESFNAMQVRITRLVRERTQMVGAIAHDLRTPLTRLAFRLDDLPSPMGEKVASDIQEMKSMISAALDFLKDRSLAGEHERLDLRLLVERVVNDQIDLGHDVTLEAGPPITIEGTPLGLRRMVTNLVDNALKYGERARLGLREAFGHVVLEIDDDGPGIPESLQAQVFEPFYRLEGSRNRDTGGIGLGLSTVRAIVLDHDGEITLGNRKGGGLRITIAFPRGRT